MATSEDSYLKFLPYQEVYTGIRTALTVNEGIIKLIGNEGCGKSAMCRQLVRHLKAEGEDVIFFETPPESIDFLHEKIRGQLGLDKARNFNKALTEYLYAKSSPHKKLVMIYDDAEKIGKDIFILMRLLNNIQDERETLVAQVICGTPELDRKFDDPDLRSLTQYLNQSFVLEPMTREQLGDFCAGYLKHHDLDQSEISGTDITNIFMISKGKPGKALELLQEMIQAGPLEAPPKRQESGTERVSQSIPATTQPTGAKTARTVKPAKGSVAAAPPGDRESRTSKPGPTSPAQTPTPPRPPARKPGRAATLSADTAIPTLSPESPPRKSAARQPTAHTANSEPALSDYQTEVDAILDADDDYVAARSSPMQLVFKLALSALVLAVAIGLSFLFTGRDEPVGDRLAGILADDSPLYLDEVDNADTGNSGSPDRDLEPAPVAVVAGAIDTEPPVEAALAADMGDADDMVPARTEPAVATGDEETTPPLASGEGGAAGTEPTVDIADDVETAEPALVSSPVPPPAEPFENSGTVSDPAIPEAPASRPGEQAIAQNDIPLPELMATIVGRWLESWESQDVAAYLSAYTADFQSAYHDTYLAWREDRVEKISRPGDMEISFDRLEIMDIDNERVTLRIWLYYARAGYADETWKELIFSLRGGQWLIASERNLEVKVR